jgi:hypothetical protein
VERSRQLDDMVQRCAELKKVRETESLAEQLHPHLCDLQRNFNEAHAQLQSRLIFLQV